MQSQEKGSYRLPGVLAYIAWILDRSRIEGATASSQATGTSGSAEDKGPTSASSCAGSGHAAPAALVSTSAPSPGKGHGPALSCASAGSSHAVPPPLASTSASSQDAGDTSAPSQGAGQTSDLKQEQGRTKLGKRVIYLLDWFAPHLDTQVDTLIHSAGHAVLRIGGHLTGLVQVEDTHAHGPMTKAYKKIETLEAHAQLELRPDKLPSTSRQTVMDRALGSWLIVNHESCSHGFDSNGIANKLGGSEDPLLTLEVRG